MRYKSSHHGQLETTHVTPGREELGRDAHHPLLQKVGVGSSRPPMPTPLFLLHRQSEVNEGRWKRICLTSEKLSINNKKEMSQWIICRFQD